MISELQELAMQCDLRRMEKVGIWASKAGIKEITRFFERKCGFPLEEDLDRLLGFKIFLDESIAGYDMIVKSRDCYGLPEIIGVIRIK